MKQQRWQRMMQWPLTGAAVVFLGAYSWQVLADLTGPYKTVTDSVINITWVLFAVDYVITLALAERRHRWFITHLFDFAVVALPLLRPLRLLRLVTLVTVLQRRATSALRGRVVTFAAASTALLIFVASLAELDAERHTPGSLIRTFPEALWWAFVTITTVGYGDFYPVTGVGRLIAAGVMLSGIALIGVVTATLASYIVERVAENDTESDASTRHQVEELVQEIRQLRSELGQMTHAASAPTPDAKDPSAHATET